MTTSVNHPWTLDFLKVVLWLRQELLLAWHDLACLIGSTVCSGHYAIGRQILIEVWQDLSSAGGVSPVLHEKHGDAKHAGLLFQGREEAFSLYGHGELN